MNKARRAILDQLVTELTDVQSRLESVRDDEESARDAIPESMEGTDRYAAAVCACDALEEATDHFAEMLSNIDEALNA